jgi:AcrR family transcriptional regulator
VYTDRAMAVNARRAPAGVRGAARAVARDEARLAALRQRREREHEALLRAARRVFLCRGYAGTRVEDILQEASISTRAFYRFHASKDEIFLELFDRANAAAIRRLEERVAGAVDAQSQLAAYIEATLDLAYDPRLAGEVRLFATVPAGVAERYAAEVLSCREQLVSVLQGILERARGRGEIGADGDPEIEAWAMHGALSALLERALSRRARPERAALARIAERLILGALGAAAPHRGSPGSRAGRGRRAPRRTDAAAQPMP